MKITGQLYYLSEKLVALALFDNDLNENTKDKMITAMKDKESEKIYQNVHLLTRNSFRRRL